MWRVRPCISTHHSTLVTGATMPLKDQINDDLRTALRAGDDLRKTTLRGLLAAVRAAEDVAVKAKVDAARVAEDAE